MRRKKQIVKQITLKIGGILLGLCLAVGLPSAVVNATENAVGGVAGPQTTENCRMVVLRKGRRGPIVIHNQLKVQFLLGILRLFRGSSSCLERIREPILTVLH